MRVARFDTDFIPNGLTDDCLHVCQRITVGFEQQLQKGQGCGGNVCLCIHENVQLPFMKYSLCTYQDMQSLLLRKALSGGLHHDNTG